MGRRLTLFVLITLLFACTGATFRYKHYTLQMDDYGAGQLLGQKPEDDLPTEICRPDDENKAKCFVVLHDTYMQIKRDYINIQKRLRACERGMR